MTIQLGTTLRNALLATYESTIGTSPKRRYYTGTKPTVCSASATGTLLVEMTLPSDWMDTPGSGGAAKLGAWSGTALADGTAGYYRIYDSAGTTCHEQGTVTQAFGLTTSGTTTAPSNVLNFASTTGVTVGMPIFGSGVLTGATVAGVTSTTVTMSAATVIGVGSGVTITFGDYTGDENMRATALTSGQTVTVDYRLLTAPGP